MSVIGKKLETTTGGSRESVKKPGVMGARGVNYLRNQGGPRCRVRDILRGDMDWAGRLKFIKNAARRSGWEEE